MSLNDLIRLAEKEDCGKTKDPTVPVLRGLLYAGIIYALASTAVCSYQMYESDNNPNNTSVEQTNHND